MITIKDAPEAIGTYSQGIRVGDFIYTSGQIPIDPKSGNLITGDIKMEIYRQLNIKENDNKKRRLYTTDFEFDERDVIDFDVLFESKANNASLSRLDNMTAATLNFKDFRE